MRLADHAIVPQHQGDDDAANATVAIHERVQRLEFHMGNRGLEQFVHGRLMDEAHQRLHPAWQAFRGDRDEGHRFPPRLADEVLLGLVGSG